MYRLRTCPGRWCQTTAVELGREPACPASTPSRDTARAATAMIARRWARVGVLIAALLGSLSGLGCGPEQDPAGRRSLTALPDVDDPAQGAVLSEELMLALSLAKNYHHKADLLLQEAEPDQAATALQAILAIRFPEGAPEAEDVRLDARARLAKLLAAQGKLDEAGQLVADGLRGAPRRSFFLANLYTVQGEIHEARAAFFDQQASTATSDAARAQAEVAAGEARRDAIRAFDESIQINRALQQSLLGEGGP